MKIHAWKVVAMIAASLPWTRADAQFEPPLKPISREAAAESVAVVKALITRVAASPGDGPAQFHLGTLAYDLTRQWRVLLPAAFAKQYPNEALQNIAIDALNAALRAEPENTQYLIATGYRHLYSHRGDKAQRRAWAREYWSRATAVFRTKGDSAGEGSLARQIGDVYFDLYDDAQEGSRREAMVSFTDVPENVLKVPATASAGSTGDRRETQNNQRTSTNRSSAGDRDAAAGRTAAGTNAQGEPLLGKLGASIAPHVNYSDVSVSSAARQVLDQPLRRILGVASVYAIENLAVPPEYVFREAHLMEAETFYNDAHRAYARDALVWRSVSRLRAERNRWKELETLSEERTRLAPSDGWGWMVLGLAQQRQGSSAAARASLDRGLQLLPARDRAHLDKLDRVLRPSEQAGLSRADSATRAQAAAGSWLMAMPLWSTGTDDPRTEFLARIAFAEVRWGDLEAKTFGADTQNGQLYVRYGPPGAQYRFFHLYGGGLVFAPLSAFTLDRALTIRTLEWQPSRWDNIAATRIDSMPVQAARFRATADSVDFYFATRAPVESLAKAGPMNAAAFTKTWLASQNSPAIFRDSLPLSRAGDIGWTHRIAPGPYYYRAEAVVPGVLAAGRAAGSMMMGNDAATGFTLSGFGMSDLLLAANIGVTTNANRWRDLDIAPLTRDVNARGKVGLVWENYGLSVRNGSASYHVTIALSRDAATASDGDVFEVEGVPVPTKATRGMKEFTVEFDRSVPASDVVVDHITLSIGTPPPGAYTVMVTVKDNPSGRTTARSARLSITR